MSPCHDLSGVGSPVYQPGRKALSTSTMPQRIHPIFCNFRNDDQHSMHLLPFSTTTRTCCHTAQIQCRAETSSVECDRCCETKRLNIFSLCTFFFLICPLLRSCTMQISATTRERLLLHFPTVQPTPLVMAAFGTRTAQM